MLLIRERIGKSVPGLNLMRATTIWQRSSCTDRWDDKTGLNKISLLSLHFIKYW